MNRILRDGINTSEIIDQLDYPAEVFYRRLMSEVDDFGRFDARPIVVKGKCYLLRLDRVREADVSRWMAECQKAGAIALFEVDGKPFLVVLKVDRPRAQKSKYPQPPKGIKCWRGMGKSTVHSADLQAEENICAQTEANVPYSHSSSHSDAHSSPPTGGEGGKSRNGAEKPRKHPPKIVRSLSDWTEVVGAKK